MSLFPAAGLPPANGQQKIKQEKSSEADWLQNKSYHADRASKLAELQQRRSESSSSSDESDYESRREKKRKTERGQSPPRKIQRDVKAEPMEDEKFRKVAFVVDQLDASSLKFKADKNPDMDNVHFGRPYKVLMPKFYRGLIYCVGTPKWKYIQLTETRKKKKRKKHRNDDKNQRYYNQKTPVSLKFIPKDKDNSSIPASRHQTGNFLKLTDENSVGVAVEKEDDDVVVEDPVKKTTERLNRLTRENPGDVETWLELVSWQDEVMKESITHGRSRIVTEKKVEILNHAVKANPKIAKLQLMRLRLQSELMADIDALDKEWQNMLFRFPDHIEVWKAYVLHINCNNFTSFSLKRTRRAYGHCIEILRSIKDGTYKQEASSEIPAESRLVQVFAEYAYFLAATGHTEQMVAMYQCILELNFRGPDSETSWSDLVDYIKLYFNSKERRIGEVGSRGFQSWASKHVAGGWVVEGDVAEMVEEDDDDADEIDADESLVKNWLKIDKLRCEKHWLPWRPSFDGDECDDDERKVSFSEIKDLMFTINDNTQKVKLLIDFLHILGSPACCATTTTEPFSNQHISFFTHPKQPMKSMDTLFATKPLSFGRTQGSSLGTLSNHKHSFMCEVFSQLLKCTSDKSLKRLLCSAYMSYYEQRVISFYVDNDPKNLKSCGKQAKKIARELLSLYPDLYRVWCSFAVIEWLSGKRAEACKIFKTTLVMSSKSIESLDRSAKSELCSDIHFICRTFAQLHFTTCGSCSMSEVDMACPLKSSLLSILTALGDGYKFSDYASKSGSALRPTSIMKASSGYERIVEELGSLYEQYEYEKDMHSMLENNFLSSYFDVLCCHFIHLVTSQSFKDHCAIHNGISFLRGKIKCDSFQAKIDLEHIYLLYLQFIKGMPATNRNVLRKYIYGACSEFPNNPFFAQLLGEVDMASYLSRDVRRHFTKVCTQNGDSVIPWLCATNFELSRRKRILLSTENQTFETGSLLDTRIRNLFEHGLASGSNRGSVVLWRAYLAAQIEMDPSKALGIYTRAVDSCSWARDLYLDILELLPDKLVEVVENMSKKGLRLRTPVEEIQLLMAM